MSVLERGVIDFAGVDENKNDFALGISDHLDWVDIKDHIEHLSNKIEDYLVAIKSNEIYDLFPDSKNLNKIILVYGKYKLSKSGVDFYSKHRRITEELDWKLEFKLFNPS